MNKYVVFISIVLVAVFLDLWTKNIAENNLASVTSRWDHSLELNPEIDPDEVLTLEEYIDGRFGEGALDSGSVRGVSIVDSNGQSQPGMGLRVLNEGETVRIGYRKVEIVPGFWNHVYVQNYGAAWGFLSGRDARFVRPFFLTISIIAVIIVFGIFRGVRPDQKLLTAALSLIVGGALGNFVDRARYGYVVDFVDWYATWGGAEHHWPTFNVADVWITIGVAFMLIEIMLNNEDDVKKSDAAEADSAAA